MWTGFNADRNDQRLLSYDHMTLYKLDYYYDNNDDDEFMVMIIITIINSYFYFSTI